MQHDPPFFMDRWEARRFCFLSATGAALGTTAAVVSTSAAETAAVSAAAATAATATAGATAATAAGISTASLLAYGGLASSVIGTAAGAIGAENSAKAQAGAAAANATIAQNNQTVANQNATSAVQAGDVQAGMSSQRTKATIGAITAGQAASGVDVNSGSAVDVRSSAASLGELDAINIRANAARQAYGYQTQGSGYNAQASIDEAASQNASIAGGLGAATTFLGGAGSAASNWARYQQSGGMLA